MKKQFFKTRVGDRMIRLGLSSLAVLEVIAEGVGQLVISFPKKGTSFGQVLRDVDKLEIPSFQEYYSVLREISGYNLSVILHRLKEKGLVERINEKEYRPTRQGKLFLKDVHENDHNQKPRWDGKWRLITFDIPEKLHLERDWLRYHLRTSHYKMLHKSVFVGKFPLDEEAYKNIYRKRLGSYVRILTVGEIDEGGFD